MANWEIIKGDDGKDYVQLNGIVMIPTGREIVQSSPDEYQVMTTGSDEPVATFTADGEQKEWEAANPTYGGVPVVVSGDMPSWMGPLMIPGAIIGQTPDRSGLGTGGSTPPWLDRVIETTSAYTIDTLGQLRSGFGGPTRRSIAGRSMNMPSVTTELWMPEEVKPPPEPPPAPGRFRNLDFEEMP